jgi:hypothetical protein
MANPIMLGNGTSAKSKSLVGTSTNILALWNGTDAWAAVAASGDVSLTSLGAFTVTGVRGITWSATTPTVGQVPTYNGSSIVWASPASGGGSSGGTGLTYFLNYSQSAASPPSGTWEVMSLTPTSGPGQNTGAVTAPQGTWANLADFVMPVGQPGETTIPPGFWDLNVYLLATGSANETQFRFSVYTWDGSTLNGPLATSEPQPITDPGSATPVLYDASLYLPATTLTSTQRIAIKVEVQRTVSSAKTVTGYFENGYYSHVHTSIGVPGSTGLLKVVNGIVQAPASLLYSADISGASGGLDGAGKLFIGRTSGNSPAVATLTGTTNRVTVTNADGTITLSGPQDLGTTNSPTFAGLTLSGLTGYLYGNGGSGLSASTSIPASAITSIPNDVSGEVGGVPDASTEIFHFRGARAWALASSGHVGGCVVAPSAETTFDIYKNTTSTVIGTMVISTGGVMTISISASGATLNFSTTDVLFVKTRSAINGVDKPYWTFLGTVA